MDIRQKLTSYWQDIANQNAHSLGEYFITDAYIRWNNTNEHFTVQEFIAANCEYPGDWMGEIERIEIIYNTAITVTRVWLADDSLSFH
ncbi:MAG: nuclear transport factor 2 family protein, partial [Oscillospiraceae bacterium]